MWSDWLIFCDCGFHSVCLLMDKAYGSFLMGETDWGGNCLVLMGGAMLSTVHFNLVSQLCPTLCDPMDCSTPGLPVHHQLLSLLKLMSIESVMPSNHLYSAFPFSSRLQSLPASWSFPMNQLFASGGQSIGVSASTSVLQVNIQDRFPLGWTGLISLLSKGHSRVFSHPTVQKHQFFRAQLFL